MTATVLVVDDEPDLEALANLSVSGVKRASFSHSERLLMAHFCNMPNEPADVR
jgi:hypothetical protein